jgi:hypothetical protein
MRTGGNKRYRKVASRDLIAMWGGLLLLCIAIGVFVARTNECVAADNASHPFYDRLPGLALEGVPDAARVAVTAHLNARYCTCGCLMTLASCLNNHMSCRTGKRLADEILQSVRSDFQPVRSRP